MLCEKSFGQTVFYHGLDTTCVCVYLVVHFFVAGKVSWGPVALCYTVLVVNEPVIPLNNNELNILCAEVFGERDKNGISSI